MTQNCLYAAQLAIETSNLERVSPYTTKEYTTNEKSHSNAKKANPRSPRLQRREITRKHVKRKIRHLQPSTTERPKKNIPFEGDGYQQLTWPVI